jgi:hypothetical protein
LAGSALKDLQISGFTGLAAAGRKIKNKKITKISKSG